MYYDATSTPAINHRNGDLAFLLAHPVDVPPPMTVRESRAVAVEATRKKPYQQEQRCLAALSESSWMMISEIMSATGYCRVTCQKAMSRLFEKKLIEKQMVRIGGKDKNMFRVVGG